MNGRLEVITGPMFSGKSEELIRRLTRARIGGKNVRVFKPVIDNRYDDTKVVSLAGSSIDAHPMEYAQDIDSQIWQANVVGIDEAQFFDESILWLAEILPSHRDVTVIVAGLDMTAEGKPFGFMPQLMAMADTVQKLTAVCHQCGEDAMYSQFLGTKDSDILVGGEESYEARCRRCWRKP